MEVSLKVLMGSSQLTDPCWHVQMPDVSNLYVMSGSGTLNGDDDHCLVENIAHGQNFQNFMDDVMPRCVEFILILQKLDFKINYI